LAVPVFPNHTDRSIFINQQALPLLESETLAANYSLNGIQMISGATYTSQGFLQSLQSALLKAQKI
ncbi:MAG: FMN-binding protein, partial [Actinobacteria bacterium]|nr:FMN-binding protein [Actinomycetota bacterium]